MLVKLLEHEDEDCHRNAAGALKNLSYGRYMDDNKVCTFRIAVFEIRGNNHYGGVIFQHWFRLVMLENPPSTVIIYSLFRTL